MTTETAPLLRKMEITNMRGLHARASAKFVQLVSGYDAEVEVEKDGMKVGGTSIMGLMMRAASPSSFINVSASGRQAEQVMEALHALIADKFGEGE